MKGITPREFSELMDAEAKVSGQSPSFSLSTNEFRARIPRPPISPSVQTPVAKVAMAFLGMTLARPQKVMGPAAAAVNRSVAAGAVPIPASSKAATSGISKSSGTLIRMPSVAAREMPSRWFPR